MDIDKHAPWMVIFLQNYYDYDKDSAPWRGFAMLRNASQLTWTNTVHQLAFPRHRNEQQTIVFYILATFNKYQARCLLSRPEVSTGLNPCFEILHRWFRPIPAPSRRHTAFFLADQPVFHLA